MEYPPELICREDVLLGVECQKEGKLLKLKLNRRQTTERPKGNRISAWRCGVFESPALSSQTKHTGDILVKYACAFSYA